MRTHILGALLLMSGCGDDGQTGNHPPPRVIPGGGIGDGAIDGVVNLYVIDDDTRMPIANAEVSVGEMSGTTDADGLFVADGVTGAQTVTAKAAGFRAEMWLAANGANMTMNLARPTEPDADTATVSGTVDLSSFTVPSGHLKAAVVSYLQSDDLGDKANGIETALKKNICAAIEGGMQTCDWSVTTRTGDIGLIAFVVDIDPGPTASEADNITSLIGFAHKENLTVTKGQTMGNVGLDVIASGDVSTETANFGTPPANLTNVLGIVGIETAKGVYQVPIPLSMTAPSTKTPKLAAIGATGYRLTGIAGNTAEPPTQSIVLRRKQTAATLDAGTWITPPTGVSLTRTHATFTPVAGATVHSVEFKSGESGVLNVTIFDNAGSFDIPAAIALPAGTIDAKVQAIVAAGLDVNDFELDRDKDKLDTVGATPAQVTN